MSDSVPTAPPNTASFSIQDRFLIEKSEEAVRDGLQLARWCREQDGRLPLFPLELGKSYELPNRAEGFFGSVTIGGQDRPVMGCRQEVDFGRLDPTAKGGELLREFVLGQFLGRAHWTYPDGFPGGFTFERSLFRRTEGPCDRFPAAEQNGCIDWRDLGRKYAWVLLTVQIHDFVMDFGPIRKRFREAACVTAHPDFVHVVENPSKEYVLEVSVGYPFVEFAPIPNVFGFGPGKFGVAVKLYSFFLTPENDVRVRMFFAASPRCRKVIDLGTSWPDPVYGGASLLHRLTLGRWNPQPFHDRVDAQMLAQHCRVHQALMEGAAKVWRDWLKEVSA